MPHSLVIPHLEGQNQLVFGLFSYSSFSSSIMHTFVFEATPTKNINYTIYRLLLLYSSPIFLLFSPKLVSAQKVNSN